MRPSIFLCSVYRRAAGHIVAESDGLRPTHRGVASGGVPEYVESGVNGILAAKPSPEAIAEAILPLLNESAIRDRIGKRARKDMTERFSSDVMVENTILAYEDVVRKHHDAASPAAVLPDAAES